LTNPCLIIPIGRVDLEVVVWIEREVMPYSWLAIPSLILLFLSIGLLFTYINTKMLEWKLVNPLLKSLFISFSSYFSSIIDCRVDIIVV